MQQNAIKGLIDSRIRLAVLGGGPGSFIGAVHRMAAILDGNFEIVAGALSSKPQKSVSDGLALGLKADRAYPSADALFAGEAGRADGAQAVAIMTPNDSHFGLAMAALEHGFHVICDKPMTNNAHDAALLDEAAQKSGLVFCLTHNYTGYPMVRQARALVEAGELGKITMLQVEYVQGGRARTDDPPAGPDQPWRFNPTKSGPSLVLGDIGSHAHNLVRYVTGLEVTELCAEVGTIVPGRQVHDCAGALLHLEGGARGVFWVTQAAAGVENYLAIRVCGERGSLEWNQEAPQSLIFKPLDGPARIYTPNGHGNKKLALRSVRIVKGHPEGFIEAFANIYSDAAHAIASRIAGTSPDPLCMTFPTSADGLAGMRFIEAMLSSQSKNSQWVSLK